MGKASDCLKWTDSHQGYFRIASPERLAREWWGVYRSKDTMDYDKMSRAMRYYYNRKILDKTPHKLLFKFNEGIMKQVKYYRRLHDSCETDDELAGTSEEDTESEPMDCSWASKSPVRNVYRISCRSLGQLKTLPLTVSFCRQIYEIVFLLQLKSRHKKGACVTNMLIILVGCFIRHPVIIDQWIHDPFNPFYQQLGFFSMPWFFLSGTSNTTFFAYPLILLPLCFLLHQVVCLCMYVYAHYSCQEVFFTASGDLPKSWLSFTVFYSIRLFTELKTYIILPRCSVFRQATFVQLYWCLDKHFWSLEKYIQSGHCLMKVLGDPVFWLLSWFIVH